MAKVRKTRKAVRKPVRAKTANLPGRRAVSTRRRTGGPRSKTVAGQVMDALRETGSLRKRLAGRDTFED
jgi:hypothetical protein